MRVLVACEESQRVCLAFREHGYEAYSCDTQPCSGGHPEWHIQGDCIPEVLYGGYNLIIAHPPCTYLSVVGNALLSPKCEPEALTERWRKRVDAAVFFMRILESDCPYIAIENPRGCMNTAYRKPDQTIHPYMFASDIHDEENYIKKRTCLWLKGLPLLKTNNLPEPQYTEHWSNGKAKTWTERLGSNKDNQRAKTFPGVANAMAAQWGEYVAKLI